MAKSKDNIITHGLSGTIGDILVFRQSKGRTIVSKKPSTRASTQTQLDQQRKFKKAVIYAKAALADPALKAAYKAKGRGIKSAYNVAIADYFGMPDIEQIDVSGYTGQAGSPIIVRVTDDFQVKQVRVNIHNGGGSFVEQGLAVLQPDGLDWLYVSTAANAAVSGYTVSIEASDVPGNVSYKTQVLA